MDGRSYRQPRMYRVVGANLVSALICVLHFTTHSYAQIPYTPSSLLYPPQQNVPFAYLLRPTNANQPQTEFLSLNVSEKVDPADPSYTVLLEEVPLYDENEISAYISAIDQNGIVKLYTGDCWGSGNPPMVWTFEPDPDSPTGNGTWQKLSVRGEDGQTSAIHGPNYLSAGFAYSPSNITESSLFAFGGMCPYQGDSGNLWTTAANYSQSMTVLEPVREDNFYQVSTTGERAPPIPEAGFTITPLQATYSYSDDEQRQQQSFLLIGGHTQQAFINMSELAIFSAPQNSWSFVTVDSVTDTQRTDLAFRDAAVIEPRSGHTSVLSSDGSKVVVFGGWVGNTSIPAVPQLAILEIGGGFAGAGDWAWKIPSMEDSGIPDGSGIYGHGATMLPGGIMMIAGGYETSQLSKRSEDGPQLNSRIILYDVDANAWPSSYENPNFIGSAGSTSSKQSSSSRKAGLGVGIGLGIPAAAGAAVFAFYYCRRRRVRRTRDSEIRQLALGAQRAHFWGREDSELASSVRNPPSMRDSFNSDYPWGNNKPRSLGKKPGWKDHGDAAAERTGLLGDVHIAKRITRPALNAGVYRPPYHDYGRSDTPGNIHPIDEREEDEVERINTRDTAETTIEQVFVTARNTQVDGAHILGVLPEHPGVVAGAGEGNNGPLSPEKDERTSSNLSDSSTSAKSAKSARLSRIVPSNASALRADETNSLDKLAFVSSHKRDAVRSQDSSASATSSFEKRYSSDSYSTAHSTLSQRQAEGEYLLREDPESSHFLDLFNSKPTISARPRASEWIGGIRRVLSVTRRRPATHESSNTVTRASGIDGRNTVIGLPTATAGGKLPRRSVSASAELFRRKQGAKDWGVSNGHESGFRTARSTRDDFGIMELDSDEDWDVEGAAEGRRVQVTFTVPREKLRVVNATASDMDNLSVNSVSRSNSSS
ncbi:hypothetical protein BJX62DRAFT_35174 [Aspergillus germanicus]